MTNNLLDVAADRRLFEPSRYVERRAVLSRAVPGGLLLFLGNGEAAMNYRDNAYPFVQDAAFLYLFGLAEPDLAGLIDADSGESWLFGADTDIEMLVWHGARPSLTERAALIGVQRTGSADDLDAILSKARGQGRTVHYLPPYRGDAILRLSALLDREPAAIEAGASTDLIRAMVAQREIKGAEEIAEMEAALQLTATMHGLAMAESRPGRREYEIVGGMEGLVHARDRRLAYPIIFTTRGEILHNHDHHRTLTAGDIIINDAGTASAKGYASDITRTIPVGGRFATLHGELYDIVVASQQAAIDMIAPDVRFVDVHKRAMRVLVEGLAGYGVFAGDPDEVVESGAYAIICQGGLGHQIGLDVHDMEGLGEDHVGYDGEVRRSPLFGLNRLRMGKRLKPGMTLTVEPGLYFIPPLIDQWAAEARHAGLIRYDRLRALAGAGGLRVEDEVVVTAEGCRILGPHIPRTRAEVEAATAS